MTDGSDSQRLDSLLAARGLARSRNQAAALIVAGGVRVDGRTRRKPATRVPVSARIDIEDTGRYVSRAAHKLIAALDAFGIDPIGALALDLGASTGGFTQVLRERGASPVIALDVGHDQLAAEVREDPGVIVVEGRNARLLSARALAEATGVTCRPGIVTGDLSFISLRQVLPAIASVADPAADVILLIKPQFEVGRTGIRAGIVTDPGQRAGAVTGVLDAAWASGLGTEGLIASPVLGMHGNREYLGHFRRSASAPPAWWERVDRLTLD